MKIKQIPEDFIVVEHLEVPKKDKGSYTYFYLKKQNYDTIKALQTIAKKVHIPVKKFGFAGNKDKKAITTQLCSVQGSPHLQKLELKDIDIEIYGKGDNPISLGDLEGNCFKITIRDIASKPKIKNECINYFGEQRFSKNNAEIGKLLVQKQFEKAISLMQHPEIKEHHKKHPKDFIGALRKVPKKLLRLYVHSYQSLLWNEMIKKYKPKTKTFPIIGFDTEPDEMIEETLKEEKITLRDFIFPQIKELSSPGTEREIKIKAKNLKIGKLVDDELNKGKKKITLEFILPKGAYATVFIKEIYL